MAKYKQNLGEGDVKKLLIRLAVPTVIAQIVNLLYNIVDRIYIGRMPETGGSALTGVGLFAPILMLISACAVLVGAGGAPRAAIALGQNDKKAAERIVGNSFTLLLCFAVALTSFFYTMCPTLLRLFGASDVTLPYAVEYAHIYVLGAVFILIVLGMNPFITAQGFTKISMMTTLIGAVINIILDPIMIFGLKMGVRGAATATVLSQMVGALWILRFLSSDKSVVRLKRENMALNARVILPCLALGISTFVMQSTESILSICFNSSLAKYGGDLAVGSMTIITSTAQIVTLPIMGICQGGQPLVSFNFGAGQKERVKKAFRYELTACAGYACFFCLLLMFVPSLTARIFTTDKDLIRYSAWAVRIYFAGFFAIGFQITCQQSFMALGQAKISLLMACLRKLILLIPLIYILPHFTPNPVFGVFLAEPISDILAAATTTTMFLTRFKGILDRGAVKIGE